MRLKNKWGNWMTGAVVPLNGWFGGETQNTRLPRWTAPSGLGTTGVARLIFQASFRMSHILILEPH